MASPNFGAGWLAAFCSVVLVLALMSAGVWLALGLLETLAVCFKVGG